VSQYDPAEAGQQFYVMVHDLHKKTVLHTPEIQRFRTDLTAGLQERRHAQALSDFDGSVGEENLEVDSVAKLPC
jgi:hypothetical protein